MFVEPGQVYPFHSTKIRTRIADVDFDAQRSAQKFVKRQETRGSNIVVAIMRRTVD